MLLRIARKVNWCRDAETAENKKAVLIAQGRDDGGATKKGRAEARPYTRKRRPPKAQNKKAALITQSGFLILIPATTYVPTQLPVQYHRPGEA
jgi:hypothetical protein